MYHIIKCIGVTHCVRTGRVFSLGEEVAFISGVGLVGIETLTDEDKVRKVKVKVEVEVEKDGFH